MALAGGARAPVQGDAQDGFFGTNLKTSKVLSEVYLVVKLNSIIFESLFNWYQYK